MSKLNNEFWNLLIFQSLWSCQVPLSAVMQLPLNAQRILQEIVNHIVTSPVIAGRPDTYAGYKQIHDNLGLTLQAKSFGLSLKNQGLLALANWAKNAGLPAITGLVVDKTKESENYLRPGVGFFEVFDKLPDDPFAWWKEQVTLALNYPWDQFLAGSAPKVPLLHDSD